ncbi:hypothetical protein BN946_scf185000.g91 [Trametes cinnabarina]|uniref:WLM domain-containing protein n=1 Tax=Pycnoporus cinnabarinus TaxID=5643 RepID=A0A060S977_PYCCI|nr:hypothetical protein BN946_scf185000.g91 [Trametes cinnabarina]
MVHVRLNEKEANPNPHINFITPLKYDDTAAEEEARQLLRALAAQVRPIMKAEGFVVNSFEELAHIKHMNHGSAFQALWAKLRNDVRELQRKGYYGDGYWSSGIRLADSAPIGGHGHEAVELPEFMCGGAQSRARPTALGRRRRRRQQAGPSNHTGAQTAKRRKAGSRVTAQGTFKGSGRALNEDLTDEDAKKAGAGFRKKAASKRAREERALAAERRLRALQRAGSDDPAKTKAMSDDGADESDEGPPETDQDRRDGLLKSINEADLDGLRASRQTFLSDFFLPPAFTSTTGTSSQPGHQGARARSKGKETDVIELSDDEESGSPACDFQILPEGGAAVSARPPSGLERRAKTSSSERIGKLAYGALVQDEMQTRKKESLGMTGAGRRLGGTPSGNKLSSDRASTFKGSPTLSPIRSSLTVQPGPAPAANDAWSCRNE